MVQRLGRTASRKLSLEAFHLLGRRRGLDSEALAVIDESTLSICTIGCTQTHQCSQIIVRPKKAAGEAEFRTIVICSPCLKLKA
eukprot:COSAG02_NODE_3356_length_6878_cov_14.421596_4_plen_84_part_00